MRRLWWEALMVRRPHLVALIQEMEMTDECGDTYLVRGEAIGFAPIPG